MEKVKKILNGNISTGPDNVNGGDGLPDYKPRPRNFSVQTKRHPPGEWYRAVCLKFIVATIFLSREGVDVCAYRFEADGKIC